MISTRLPGAYPIGLRHDGNADGLPETGFASIVDSALEQLSDAQRPSALLPKTRASSRTYRRWFQGG